MPTPAARESSGQREEAIGGVSAGSDAAADPPVRPVTRCRAACAPESAPGDSVRRPAVQYRQPHGRRPLRLPVDRHQRRPGPLRRAQLPDLAFGRRIARQPDLDGAGRCAQPALDRDRECRPGADVRRPPPAALLRPQQPAADGDQHGLEPGGHAGRFGLVRYPRGRVVPAGQPGSAAALPAGGQQSAQPAVRIGSVSGNPGRRQPVDWYQAWRSALDRDRLRTCRHRRHPQPADQWPDRRARRQPVDQHDGRCHRAPPRRCWA
ncbi:hypothetical protein G6F68_010213 [Rhizopus microsporus]|nr:hypothetical protein G6F68_010213 [Rhizopus microsporus]